jgi:uncharacterized protein (DUF4415 family)
MPTTTDDAEIADDDSPELTASDFARMRPAREVLSPDLYAALTSSARFQPAREVALSLPVEMVAYYEALGADWRERMAEALMHRSGSREPAE